MRLNSISHRCVVIADDLTGACDSGLEFARVGLRTRILFDTIGTSEADVLVLSTDSRRMLAGAAFNHVNALVSELPLDRAEVIFKKIDSTLRGNIFQECEAVRHAAHARGVVLAPALPSQGRVVENGILKVKDLTGSWSLDIGQKLREQGAEIKRVPVDALARCIADATSSSPYFLCDAATDEDLSSIATLLWQGAERMIWIGSAGLAKPIANLLAKHCPTSNTEQDVGHVGTSNPVLACIGSDHPVTARQIAYLRQMHACDIFEIASADMALVAASIAQNRHVLLIIDMQKPEPSLVTHCFEQIPLHALGGIFITGGDTAALVCAAANMHELWLFGQIQSGIARGYIKGGMLDGLPIATKSGGFGSKDSLAHSIDYLSTAPRCRREQLA